MEFNFQEGNISDQIRQALKAYDNPKAKEFREIAERLGATANYVKTTYYRDKQKTVQIEVEGGETWEVKNGKYIWETDKGIINIPVEFIDQLFYAYTEHGLNYDGTKIRNTYKLKPWEWNSIKNRLQLTKTAHIFSPYTWDNTPPQDRPAMVSKKMAEKFNDTGHIVKDSHDRELVKAYKGVLLQSAKAKFFGDELKAELLTHLPIIEKYRISRIPEPYKTDCITATITDLHIGAQVEGLRATQDYNNEVCKVRLKEIAQIINEQGAKEVHINILGDLIESFTGLNHPNSWKSMQYGQYGVTVVKTAYSILLDFLCSINNLAQVNSVGGNHDRPTASNKEESNGEIADLISFMLATSLKSIKFTYNHSTNAQVIDGINYILVHGNKGNSKDPKIGALLFEYGRQDMFNLVLAGHDHSRKISCDSRNYRKYTVPSVFTGNGFSEDLGYSSTAGFIITFARKGLPLINDYTLS